MLLGDFNIDLNKTNLNNNASEFLDITYSSYLTPHITSSTRLKSRSHTLIDNIMSNVIIEVAISGNTTNTVSDHLGQFLILAYPFTLARQTQHLLKRVPMWNYSGLYFPAFGLNTENFF